MGDVWKEPSGIFGEWRVKMPDGIYSFLTKKRAIIYKESYYGKIAEKY